MPGSIASTTCRCGWCWIFSSRARQDSDTIAGWAFVMDIRDKHFLSGYGDLCRQLKDQGYQTSMVYLQTDEQTPAAALQPDTQASSAWVPKEASLRPSAVKTTRSGPCCNPPITSSTPPVSAFMNSSSPSSILHRNIPPSPECQSAWFHLDSNTAPPWMPT